MAKLKIYNSIVDEEERLFYEYFGVSGAVSFDSIEKFIEDIPKDDNEIDIEIKSDGGYVNEGMAIYDALRNTDKTISATIVGNSASMATIILLAAPKERRFARQNAKLMIHFPWVPYVSGNADDLQKVVDSLRESNEEFLNIYTERTGADKQVLSDLMSEEKYINTDKAKELGFISKVIEYKSASNREKNKFLNKNNNKQNEKAMSVWAKLVALAKKHGEEIGMTLADANGNSIEIDRTKGEPEVGDNATPNGEHLMPSGQTIVIENEKISKILPKEEQGSAKLVELQNKLDEANKQLGESKSKIETIEKESADLKAKVENLEKGKVTTEQLEILNLVKTAGGLEWLKGQSSNYNPDNKPKGSGEDKPHSLTAEEAKGMDQGDIFRAFAKEQNDKIYNNKK